jgi:hypothetical protein
MFHQSSLSPLPLYISYEGIIEQLFNSFLVSETDSSKLTYHQLTYLVVAVLLDAVVIVF